MTDSDQKLEVLIRRIRNETAEIKSFELEARSPDVLPPFEAGAHIDVFPLPGISRQYSLASDPEDRSRYLIGVKREPGGRGGSNAMHSQLREGQTLLISYPRNRFALRANAGCSILLGGGIGVTPLLSMAQSLSAAGRDFELHYFARSNSQMAFQDLIGNCRWSKRMAYHFGLVPPLLNEVLEEILGRRGDDVVYICGPGPFMDVVRECAEAVGWPANAVVLEHFSADPPKLIPASGSFIVRLDRRKLEITVPPDKTIVEVLREAGIELKTSCEQGVCGTCLTAVIEGDPEHLDLYLSDEEQASGKLILPCVSRSNSKLLVLDI